MSNSQIQRAPKCALVEIASIYDWIHKATIKRLKDEFGTRLILLGPGAPTTWQDRYADIMSPEDSVIAMPEADDILDFTPCKTEAEIYEEARQFEQKYGLMYGRDIIYQDRRYSTRYNPAFEMMPRHLHNDCASHLHLVEKINYVYRTFGKILVDEKVDILLLRPDTLSGAPMVALAENLGIPQTFSHVSQYKSYLTWVDGAYRGDAMLRKYVEKQADAKIAPMKYAPDIQYKFIPYDDPHSWAGVRGIIRKFLLMTMNYMIFTFRDLIAWRRGRRTRYIDDVRHMFNSVKCGRWMIKHGIRDTSEIEEQGYLLFLLPVEPEYTTHSMAREFWDSEAIIRQVALCLPAGVTLLVKEHTANFGNRHPSFFKRVVKIQNVVWADHRITGGALTEKSLAVCSCAGTIALEASLFGKDSIVFSDRYIFNFMPHMHVVTALHELPEILSRALAPKEAEQIESFKRFGRRVYQAIEQISFDAPNAPHFRGGNRVLSDEAADKSFDIFLECYNVQLDNFSRKALPPQSEPAQRHSM